MNSFGLGIVLNFVDNATSGMNNATNTFLNMSNAVQNASRATNTAMSQLATGTLLNTMGNALTDFGNSMVGVVKNTLNSVKSVGSDFQLFNVTLQQIYGSATEAENQISKLLDFSVKSPFEVTDVKDMLVVLKSQGIEAFDSIKGSITGTEQETLQWINDLMAFKPDVPMSRWKKALQNYIGSGNQRSLREVLDMGSVDQIIGHDVSDTVEGRMNDLIEIVEKKNLTGLTDAMFGTMQQNISNIGDYFTMLYKSIGDAGVFDNLAQITGIVSKTLADFDNQSGKLPKIAAIISDAFNLILEPVVALTEKLANLVKSFLDFAIAHPTLGKIAIIMFTLAGASAVALGWILKLSGSFLMLASSIKLLGGISTIMNTLKTGFTVFGGKLLALVPLGILLYQAWKKNFLGIQNVVKDTSQKLGLIWDYFKQGYFTEEQYDLAKNLGILDTIEKISVLKYYWDEFKKGFASGWDSAFETFFNALKSGIEGLDTALKNIGIDAGLQAIIDSLSASFDALFAPGREETFQTIGEVFGAISADAIIILGTLKALSVVMKGFKIIAVIFKGIGTVFSWIGTGASYLWSAISGLGSALAWVGQAIWGVITAIAAALGISVGWVVAIIAAVIAAVAAIIIFWDEICAFFSFIGAWIYENVIVPVADFFVGLWNGIVSGVTTAWNAVVSFLSTVATWIYTNVIQPVVNFFLTYIYPFIEKIIEIAAKIIEIVFVLLRVAVQWVYNNVIAPIINFFVGLWNGIVSVFSSVVSWFGSVFSAAVNAIVTAWGYVTTFFAGIWNGIVAVFSSVGAWFGGVFSAAVTAIKDFFAPIVDFFKGIWDSIVAIFTKIGTAVSDAISGAVKGAINAVLTGAMKIVNGFIKAINLAIDVINAIPGVSITKLDLLSVPLLAKGTESFEGGKAIINEAGGELVDLPKGTRVIPHDESIEESLKEGIRLGARAMSQYNGANSNGTPVFSKSNGGASQDNRVIFSKGSIVITTVGASQAEMEKAAEFIMKYIERKQKLRSLAVRK